MAGKPCGLLRLLVVTLHLSSVFCCYKRLVYHGQFPMLYIDECSSNYDLGLLVGSTFSSMIKGRLTESVAFHKVQAYCATNWGRQLLVALQELHRTEFPAYYAELQGLAAGAGLPFDSVFMLNLRQEILAASENPDGVQRWLAARDQAGTAAEGGVGEGAEEGEEAKVETGGSSSAVTATAFLSDAATAGGGETDSGGGSQDGVSGSSAGLLHEDRQHGLHHRVQHRTLQQGSGRREARGGDSGDVDPAGGTAAAAGTAVTDAAADGRGAVVAVGDINTASDGGRRARGAVQGGVNGGVEARTGGSSTSGGSGDTVTGTVSTAAGWVDPISVDACSDVAVRLSDPQGGPPYLLLGHNEDMTNDTLGRTYYLRAAMPGRGTWFALTYAGELASTAFGANTAGVAFSLNALYPSAAQLPGLGRNFLSRRLLDAGSVAEAMEVLTAKDQATGRSVNLMSTRPPLGVWNVEIGPGGSYDIEELADDSWYFHANAYMRLPQRQKVDNSSLHREARAAQFDMPVNPEQVLAILGDTADPEFPIFRTGDYGGLVYTLCTALYDISGGSMAVFRGNPRDGLVGSVLSLETLEPLARRGKDGDPEEEEEEGMAR